MSFCHAQHLQHESTTKLVARNVRQTRIIDREIEIVLSSAEHFASVAALIAVELGRAGIAHSGDPLGPEGINRPPSNQ